METTNIHKVCNLCGCEASGKIVNDERSIELCSSCAKSVLWDLIHNDYAFDED